jgi:hypothetical protein
MQVPTLNRKRRFVFVFTTLSMGSFWATTDPLADVEVKEQIGKEFRKDQHVTALHNLY